MVSAEQTYRTQLNRNKINTRRMEIAPSVRKHVWINLRMYVNTYACVNIYLCTAVTRSSRPYKGRSGLDYQGIPWIQTNEGKLCGTGNIQDIITQFYSEAQ